MINSCSKSYFVKSLDFRSEEIQLSIFDLHQVVLGIVLEVFFSQKQRKLIKHLALLKSLSAGFDWHFIYHYLVLEGTFCIEVVLDFLFLGSNLADHHLRRGSSFILDRSCTGFLLGRRLASN